MAFSKLRLKSWHTRFVKNSFEPRDRRDETFHSHVFWHMEYNMNPLGELQLSKGMNKLNQNHSRLKCAFVCTIDMYL